MCDETGGIEIGGKDREMEEGELRASTRREGRRFGTGKKRDTATGEKRRRCQLRPFMIPRRRTHAKALGRPLGLPQVGIHAVVDRDDPVPERGLGAHIGGILGQELLEVLPAFETGIQLREAEDVLHCGLLVFVRRHGGVLFGHGVKHLPRRAAQLRHVVGSPPGRVATIAAPGCGMLVLATGPMLPTP